MLKNITLPLFIAVGLTACSGGGSGDNHHSEPTPEVTPQITPPKTDSQTSESNSSRSETEKNTQQTETDTSKESNKATPQPNPQNNADSQPKEQSEEAEKSVILKAKNITADQDKLGLTQSPLTESTEPTAGDYKVIIKTGTMIYNQKYSIVHANIESEQHEYTDGHVEGSNLLTVASILGLKTKAENLPAEGTATYSGKAYSPANGGKLNEGSLDYTVNFSTKTGSGKINGINESLMLEQGKIENTGISSTIKQGGETGKYSLNFFGNRAEEIMGEVIYTTDKNEEIDENRIIFGGSRGEIQK